MATYILSDANRFYVATENTYGIPAPVAAENRFAAFSFDCHQSMETSKRRDKTGSRTFLGNLTSATRSSFVVSSHLTSWDGNSQPSYSPLIQAAMGATPEVVDGLVVAAVSGSQMGTTIPHNLTVGSAVSNGSEIRFVVSVQDAEHFTLNTPFSVSPGVGATFSTTVGFRLANELPSVSIYDYWDPASAVSRLVTGAGVDKFEMNLRGDVHEFRFSGPAADVLDSCTSVFGVTGLSAFPAEPPQFPFQYSIVDGQLGQVWLGSPLNQVFALTEASIEINNNLLLRNQEFGSAHPMAIVPGPRELVTNFTLFAQPDSFTQSLYAASKVKTPISALVQLGQQKGQMMAIYLSSVVPEMPLFDDSEAYLLWEFKNSVGQGVLNDEAYIAFA